MATKAKVLRRTMIAMTVVAIVAVSSVFLDSLKPSAKANAVAGQYRFPVGFLDDLSPGEVRTENAGYIRVFVVVPDTRIKEDIDKAAALAKYREISTFDDQLGAYILWGDSPKDRGPHCYLEPTEGDGPNQWRDSYVPGGFFDVCSGDRFDYAGRVLVDAYGRHVQNLRKPEYERVGSDQYQITNLNYLILGVSD